MAKSNSPPQLSNHNNDSQELKKKAIQISSPTETRKNGTDVNRYFHFSHKSRLIADQFLTIVDNEVAQTLRCHTNCSRQNQGTAFLEPAINCGETQKIVFHIKNKPGRMYYFFGVTRTSKLFPPDSSHQVIRKSSLCLENLYDSLHQEAASKTKALPLFHTGSKLTLIVRNETKGKFVHLSIKEDSSDKILKGKVRNEKSESVRLFCSLYNRNAEVQILPCAELLDLT